VRGVPGTIVDIRRYAPPSEPYATKRSSSDCLDENDLAALADGSLSEALRGRVEGHLATCARCLDDYIECVSILDEVKPRHQSTVSFVVKMVRTGLQMLSAPYSGFAPVQVKALPVLGPNDDLAPDAARMLAWKQKFEDVELAFDVTKADDNTVSVQIYARIDADPLKDGRYNFRQDGRLIESGLFDEEGCIRIRSIDPGNYECAIEVPERAPLVFEFSLQ
jgi:hypothetical protein